MRYATDPGDLVIVLQRRAQTPVWGKPQNDRFSKASKIAGERTRHLSGPARVKRINEIVAEEVARLKRQEAGGA